MHIGDQLYRAIEAVHRAGLDGGWVYALGLVGALTGSRAVTVDSFDPRTLLHRSFQSWNMRPATRDEYLGLGGAVNSRVRFGVRRVDKFLFRDGDIFADEAEIDREPFYAEFLSRHDVRYFGSGAVSREPARHTFLTLLRSQRQGVVPDADLRVLDQLAPHVKLALEVADRLRGEQLKSQAMLQALDCLADGVAVLAADGRVLEANAAFQDMARACDGVGVRRGRVEFAASEASRTFAAALGRAVEAAGAATLGVPPPFAAARPSGRAPLVASMRPVFQAEREGADDARAVLFLRDPCADSRVNAAVAAEALGLTHAEADLAAALVSGLSPTDYARARRLSINTIYTHLRRLKDKTGSGRLADLIRRLNDLSVPGAATRE